MTIVVVRDGCMAADTAVWYRDAVCGHVNKITRLEDGSLVAGSGDSAFCEWFPKWLRNIKITIPDVCDDGFNGIMLRTNGQVIHFNEHLLPLVIKSPWHAIGSSSSFAFGALAAGASAFETVKLCIEHTSGVASAVDCQYV